MLTFNDFYYSYKRRKLLHGGAMRFGMRVGEPELGRKMITDNPPIQSSTRPTQLSPSVILPQKVAHATNPQDLVYAILTSEKVYYSKQELLMIIGRVDQMLSPKFDGECTYIA